MQREIISREMLFTCFIFFLNQHDIGWLEVCVCVCVVYVDIKSK